MSLEFKLHNLPEAQYFHKHSHEIRSKSILFNTGDFVKMRESENAAY